MSKKNSVAAKPETVLVLRTCYANLRSYNDFQWPDQIGAEVVAPDWSPEERCGNGLHGWLYGQGDHSCSNSIGISDAKWLVLEVVLSEIVMLCGKCKFPRCVIRHIGDKVSATAYLIEHEQRAANVAVIGASIRVGNEQTAAVGALGTATAGYRGTATAGYNGTATAGDSGTATAGDRGTICIKWHDYTKERYRTEVAYVGEGGIRANTPYRLDDNHKFVEVAK